jgi:outer membrane receptor for ferric coprogen and ferric-rhodotorulic acid
VNPASASRIEVVRGPATLLDGASASGGLVNVTPRRHMFALKAEASKLGRVIGFPINLSKPLVASAVTRFR